MANAAERGAELKAGLLALRRRHPVVGDVRGLGLMVAMDLVRAGDPATTDPVLRDEVVQTAFRRGLLLLGCGEAAVRFCPPLCITPAQVQTALALLDGVLTEVTATRGTAALVG
jgi:4-aminobutyrate aminotransferase